MIHLDLQPEVEAQLAAEAHARGLSLDQYVESIVTDHSREGSGTDMFYSSDQKLSEQELAENLRQGLADIAEGRTRPPEQGCTCAASLTLHTRPNLSAPRRPHLDSLNA